MFTLNYGWYRKYYNLEGVTATKAVTQNLKTIPLGLEEAKSMLEPRMTGLAMNTLVISNTFY